MAGMRMTALAAGLGAAMAGGPDEANAQATEIMIPLESGEEIVMNVAGVQLDTQQAILAHLETCIDAADKSRSECVAEAATLMATENLDGVVRETHQRLQPLSEVIDVPVADLIREPVFCHYAPDDAAIQSCSQDVETLQLAALDVQIAEVRERRIVAETRVAAKQDHLEGVETRVVEKEVALETSQTEGAELDTEIAEQAETIGAQAAVLAALQRVAAEEAVTN